MKDWKYLALPAFGVVFFGAASFYAPKISPTLITQANATTIQSILASICASFVFLLTLGLGNYLREGFYLRRFREFFGELSVSVTSSLVYPDFVLSEKCRDVLKDMSHTEVFRKHADQYPGTRFIDVPKIVASNDLQAIVIVATKMGRYVHDSPFLITDGQAVTEVNKSFISFGLSSNAVTDLYLNSDPHPLFKLDDVGGDPKIVVQINGKTEIYERNPGHQYGIILRYRPNPVEYPSKVWIICAGQAAAGTPAAAWNLAHRWREYQRRFGNKDFVVIFSTSNDVYSYVSSSEVCAISR